MAQTSRARRSVDLDPLTSHQYNRASVGRSKLTISKISKRRFIAQSFATKLVASQS